MERRVQKRVRGLWAVTAVAFAIILATVVAIAIIRSRSQASEESLRELQKISVPKGLKPAWTEKDGARVTSYFGFEPAGLGSLIEMEPPNGYITDPTFSAEAAPKIVEWRVIAEWVGNTQATSGCRMTVAWSRHPGRSGIPPEELKRLGPVAGIARFVVQCASS